MDDIGTKPTVRNKTISTSKLFGVDGKSSLGKVGQEKSKIGSLSKIVRNNRIKINQLEKNDEVLNSILDELTSLRSTVNSIGKSIKKQQKLQVSVDNKNKILVDRAKKKRREESLEEEKSGGSSERLKDIAKPAMGFFDMIINFLKNILIGGLLSGILKIFKDPQILLKPLQDLINNIVGFFNGIIGWIDETLIGPFRTIVNALNSGIKSLVNVINGIINALPDWFPLKPDPIEISSDGPIPQIPELPKIPEATFANPKDVESKTDDGRSVQALAGGGTVIENQNNFGDTLLNMGIPPELLGIFGNIGNTFSKFGGKFSNFDLNANQLSASNILTEKSGVNISGLGPDTQLVAAQPGEFILNKKVIDNVGVEPFIQLNSIFGGSNANKPKMVSGGKIIAAQGGGPVKKNQNKGSKSSAQVKKPTSNTSQEKDIKKGVDDKPGSGGLPAVVSAGKQLLSSGFTVAEHPNFGKGTGYDPKGKQRVGGHSPNSAHYKNLAIDVTDWRDGDWKGRTKSLAQSMFEQKDKLKLTQIIHDPWGSWFKGESKPGAAIGGHPTHLHLAFENGPGGDIESTQGSDYSGKISSSSGGSKGSIMGSSITPPLVSGGGMMPIPIPSGGKQSTQSSSAGSGQSPAPSFSSEDTMNPSLLVVKAIYNIVG